MKKIIEFPQTETGNYAIPVTIEEIKVDVYGEDTSWVILVYNEEYGDSKELRIGRKTKVNDGWEETEESIEKADRLCLELFGTDYDGLSDLGNDVLGKELTVYASGEESNWFFTDVKYTEYAKHKAESKVFKKGIITEVVNNKDNVSIIYTLGGETYRKMYSKGAWTTSGKVLPNADAKAKAAEDILMLFGTLTPEIKEEDKIEIKFKLQAYKNTFAMKEIQVPAFEDQAAVFNEWYSAQLAEVDTKLTKVQKRKTVINKYFKENGITNW